ncbi:DISARM system helicase DrmA [Limimaricola sp. G21655-S1]|uniref:DISARM system helicase DrmA n=1 Tax=Limimaricola sp. G21655-S1 TaxID=3014768 RepID=UPI0022AF2582|nr:DISARM system helicase DrmA [Limimaricola sp. G21655-S1]MCZ4262300.1 DISARM system helicase DrmA [Limimaricola sp. G21655-S1]
MSVEAEKQTKSAWIVQEQKVQLDGFAFPAFAFRLNGDPKLRSGLSIGDWVIFVGGTWNVTRLGRVMRVRLDRDGLTVYLDRFQGLEKPISASSIGLSSPAKGDVSRLAWDDFEAAVSKAFGIAVADVKPIEDQAYIRELLQLAVMDDLLGPANGPHEQIIDMGVRDRYLVGKLAPRQTATGTSGGVEGLEGPLELEAEEDEEPDDLQVHTGRHETGAEFETTTGRVDAEAEAAEEIDAGSNQSLVPSSMGLTFCVDGDVEAIEVEALWGKYVREYEHEHTKTVNRKIRDGEGNVVEKRQEEIKAKVWQRVPCGGTVKISLKEGIIKGQKPDAGNPEVRIQGTVRGKNANGDRIVTIFLVNAQEEPEENKDSAWVFQPEIVVRSQGGTTSSAIFRRRLAMPTKGDDPERDALEMVYRRQVEFAAGHGVAVHADTLTDDPESAFEVRTVIMPQYEVPVTETPGSKAEDRPAMKKMIADGHLDMNELAELERDELIAALQVLTADYRAWIEEQGSRIGADVLGHDTQAAAALARCKEIEARLAQGIAVLADPSDDKALKAFRFANLAMARQRVQSMYALSRRRGETKDLADFDIRKNRSWRPFQLAFVLLALPSLADPAHADRTKPLDSLADLLWFPTGGGKTEAYLGVAAFAMAIRRLQGKLGGYDGTRGLGVVMRYTLRLLTLQQFQRASALICAMEVLRLEAIASGDTSLGNTPFTIGLWVGNKVTPGSTDESHSAIKDIRDPDKFDAGSTSPAQLTSCPWCGSEVSDKRDIFVDKPQKRTIIYCGDKKSRCIFSKGQSSGRPHPGIPVVVVDEEIYHRPPSMMIATVDKFALMAWRGEARNLFGRATRECPRHGLLWPGSDCSGNHPASKGLPRTEAKSINPLRPPDLIIQDEFHLISGPLGTMVGLYETAIDELSGWKLDGKVVKPKIIASTATVRKAPEQVNNVFMRRVAVFPPHGLDIVDNFFSVQRPISQIPGRRYLGVCSPGSSRPAMLIRVYTAFLAASQALFDHFGQAADPYMTGVGYFNSLRELGGMKRLAEDDVQTRAYRVNMSMVDRPGLAQRSISNIDELTSRVSSRDIPKKLDQLEIKFKAEFDPASDKFVTKWEDGEPHAIDVVLATNMLSVGVDVNRLGLMVVNGQPKGTAEYIQATSRVGRASPGLVCTVLTWARPRDLSHYETFEHYHATFYKHVEAQSVTPFSPRAMDRGLTGALVSISRLEDDDLNPNTGAGALDRPDKDAIKHAAAIIVDRAWNVTQEAKVKTLASDEIKSRIDEWCTEAGKGGRTLGYEKRGPGKDTMAALLKKPGIKAWDDFTVPMSMREVEPGVRLVMSKVKSGAGPDWTPPPLETKDGEGDE